MSADPHATPAGGAGERPPRRVLYIEDEPLNVLLMTEMFRGHEGWVLQVERDGASGLRAAREDAPELLLIDMNLPDMNGLEIIARLRADPATAKLPCIALSADALPEQARVARQAGFDDYWTKPISIAQMWTSLAQWLP
ncbi:response regulator [Azohydromonas caseinilytica]|uniref:Response regulator n=1 Tax=Azohydromonas caseinilytica TaxID=2728836 RepID=A0A848FEL0_9BURK|nr:response regulator [Azohydromonas caseinilytica]NML16331.1 response regulator [Azohydromonas caseinilytica]